MYIIKGILITEDGLIFENTLVNNEEKLTLVKQRVKEVYQEQEEWFLTNIEQKNASQVERSRKRKQREQEEKLALQEKITPGKYNVFHWPEKLDVSKLNQLYRKDAIGICDEALADEVGLTMYLRCKYGKDDMEYMERYSIRCHNCGREIPGN